MRLTCRVRRRLRLLQSLGGERRSGLLRSRGGLGGSCIRPATRFPRQRLPMVKVGLYQFDERLSSVAEDGIAVAGGIGFETRPPTRRLEFAQVRLFALLSIKQPPELLRCPIRAAERRLFSERMVQSGPLCT